MGDFDIEDLKVHRIATPPRDKRRLPVAGPRPPLPGAAPLSGASPAASEAEGGTGERTEVVAPEELKARVVETLKTIFDPEIPVNIHDLGLIYGIDVSEDGDVEVRMTLTAPACPVAGMIVEDVASRVGRTPGVRRSRVELVWDPPWTKERMSEDALFELGLL